MTKNGHHKLLAKSSQIQLSPSLLACNSSSGVSKSKRVHYMSPVVAPQGLKAGQLDAVIVLPWWT
eukprot:scaffold86_cov338-Pavlova_lutheri.AAC.8